MGLFHNVLVYMGDLHLVLLALNLSIMDAGILIMVQQVRLMMFSLNIMDYPVLWDPSSCLKVMGWVVGGLKHFSVSLRPLGSLNLLGLG